VGAVVQLGIPLLSAVLTGVCAGYVGLLYRAPGSRAFAVILFAQSWWSLGYVGELLAPDLEAKLMWDDLQLPPVFIMGAALLLFAFDFTHHRPRSARRVMVLLGILPALACLWVFTDPFHGLARASAEIVPDPPFGELAYDYTLPEMLAYVELFGVGAYVVMRLVEHARGQARLYRRQTFLAACSALFVLVALLPSLFGIKVFYQRDSSPFWFLVSALLVVAALRGYRLFDLVPTAGQLVVENLPDAVLVLDARNRIAAVNPAARSIMFPMGYAVGAPARDALGHWSELSRLVAISDGEGQEIAAPDHEHTFELKSADIVESGRRSGRVIVLRDVTLRKQQQEGLLRTQDDLERRVEERTSDLSRANDALHAQVEETRVAQAAAQASERKFRAIFDGAYELISVLDLDGTLTASNRASLAFAGVAEPSVLGKPIWDGPWWAHSESLRGELRAGLVRARAGEFVRFDATHLDLGQELRSIDFSLMPLLSERGETTGLIAEGRDITERKRAEEEKVNLQAQLHQAQRLESIGRLAGGVAHDFNNLLTVIMGNVQLTRLMLQTPHEIEEPLLQIEHAAKSAGALTHRLLAFARRELIEPRVLDVNEIVTRVQKLLVRLVGEDVTVQVELAPDVHPIRVDPTQLEQILVNLVVNARDALPNGGKMSIVTEKALRRLPGAEAEAECVLLRVSDDGVGIAPEALARVFEPFYTTKPQGVGTGLGLAMVQGAVQQAGGEVTLESRLGEGTTFFLYFPKAAAEELETLIGPGDSTPPRGRETIAVVEDQAQVRATTKRELESLGYRVLEFSSAEPALAALSASALVVDLLLTDVVLPGKSGRQLGDELSEARAGLKVLFMSGYTDDVILRHGLALGKVHFLKKPFSLADLALVVRRVLDE
jgi:PAS domain S-box-containing protein